MNNPRWSVLVVGYNSPREVRALLEDLAALPRPETRETLIAENGDRELPAMRALAAEFGAQLLELPNPGFGIACNAMATKARGDLILLANPDLRMPIDIFPTLERWLSDPGVGTASPILLDEDGSLQISWNLPMGLWWEFLEAHGFQTWWRRRTMARIQEARPEGPWDVGIASAACLGMRAETYRRVGGFDEGFFLNGEDIDLCDRIRDPGARILLDPSIHCVHGNSQIQGKNLARFYSDRLEGKRKYLSRRYRGFRLFVARALWVEMVTIRWVAGIFLLRGSQRTRLPAYRKILFQSLGLWFRSW